MEGLCVVGLQAHDARRIEESRDGATATSEQLNESARGGERTDRGAHSSEERNEAIRRGRTLLLLVYRVDQFALTRVALVEITRRLITRQEACAISRTATLLHAARRDAPPNICSTHVFLDIILLK